ncbi:MAG: hypothetical protein RIR00_386 [Pseudomonadota bacterium]
MKDSASSQSGSLRWAASFALALLAPVLVLLWFFHHQAENLLESELRSRLAWRLQDSAQRLSTPRLELNRPPITDRISACAQSLVRSVTQPFVTSRQSLAGDCQIWLALGRDLDRIDADALLAMLGDPLQPSVGERPGRYQRADLRPGSADFGTELELISESLGLPQLPNWRQMFWLAVLLVLLLIGILTFWFERRVVRPLLAVARMGRRIETGDFSRHDHFPEAAPLVHDLARGLNRALDTLADSRDKLRHTRQAMAQQMAERTQALLDQQLGLESAERLAGVGHWRLEYPDGRVTWSPEIYRILECDPTSTHPSYPVFIERVHPDDRACVRRTLGRGQHSGEAYQIEHRLQFADGRQKWLRLRGTLEYRSDGQPLHALGTLQDITAEKAGREALQQREALYRAIIDTATDGFWMLDIHGHLLEVNDAYVALSGYSREELLQSRLQQLDAGLDGAAIAQVLSQVVAAGSLRFETRHRRKDGQEWHVEVVIAYSPVSDGRLFAFLRDISQRVTAETALRASQRELALHRLELEQQVAIRSSELRQQSRYLRALIDNLPFPVWFKDTASRFVVVNQRVAARLGLRPEDMIGERDERFAPPEQAVRYREEDAMIMASRCSRSFECQLGPATPGGPARWNETFKTAVVDESGVVLGTVGFFRDISHRKAIELAQQAALEEAERLARARSQFTANMSHEIRTPLNAILGFAHIGLRKSEGSPLQLHFSRIQESGRTLLGIVDDVLDFSGLEQGRCQLDHVDFRLADVLDQAITPLAARAFQQGLDFQVDEAPDLPVSGCGDPARITRVLNHLLDNAIKFTPSGSIRLRLAHRAGELLFELSDTGIGMSPEQLDRLFTPFEQADPSSTRRHGGSGLGLAVSRFLLQQMGGDLHAESQREQGSRFFGHLPLSSPDTAFIPGAALATTADVSSVTPAPARPLYHAGLSLEEQSKLETTLAANGRSALSLDTANLPETAECLLTLDWLAAPENQASIRQALEQGLNCTLLLTPGRESCPSAWQDRVRILERPFRPRQLLQHATFPQAPALETAPALTEQPGNGGERLAGLRLLIIEDNEVNRLMLEEILRQEGAWLLSAGNGREAMDILQQRGTDAFDLVLTDVQMPVMDGYEFARQAHHLAPGLPVVGLTAHALSEERSRCIAAGMVEQLTKPVDIDRLVQVLLHFTLSSPSPVSPSPALQAQPVPSPVEAPVAKATEASTDSAGDPRIDWAVLAERYNAKHDFLLKLAETLRHTYGASPTRIAALIEHRDLSNLAFLAHSLKGMGSNMAAPGLHAIALQTEQAAKQGSEETFALALRLSDAMRVLMDDLDQRFPANIPAP